jgi:hypothetical protein
MITGIGTPTIQSKSPFPIVVSSKSFDRENNAQGQAGFLWLRNFRQRKSDPEKRIAVSIDGRTSALTSSAWRLRVSRHSSSEVPEANGASAFVTSR